MSRQSAVEAVLREFLDGTRQQTLPREEAVRYMAALFAGVLVQGFGDVELAKALLDRIMPLLLPSGQRHMDKPGDTG